MVQVQFLMFQNQVNKRVNPNSILPCKKKKQKQKTNKQTFAQIVWCVTKRFQMLSEDNFKIVTYPTVPSGHHNRSQRVSLLAPVVQTLDSAIHRINHYPADSVIDFRNTYPLDSDLSGG